VNKRFREIIMILCDFCLQTQPHQLAAAEELPVLIVLIINLRRWLHVQTTENYKSLSQKPINDGHRLM